MGQVGVFLEVTLYLGWPLVTTAASLDISFTFRADFHLEIRWMFFNDKNLLVLNLVISLSFGYQTHFNMILDLCFRLMLTLMILEYQ